MTRILSELLGAKEPGFRLGLKHLEKAGGLPSEDIRLSSAVLRQTQDKIQELGLDPHDTTAEELYHSLMERVGKDNRVLLQILGSGMADLRLTARIAKLLSSLDIPKDVFAMKPAAAKKLLKQNPPKKAMKQLGYRSFDSMMKRELPATLLAAAQIYESAAWQKSLFSAYKKLQASDFSVQHIQILAPSSERWENAAKRFVAKRKHNVLSFRELGAVVLLPLPKDSVRGSALATTLLAIEAIGDMRAHSSFLKLQQVKPDFGATVAKLAQGDNVTNAELAGKSLPWQLLYRYFSHHVNTFNPIIFEPHVQPEDLAWTAPESALASLHARFEFWHGAGHLGLRDHDGNPVSLNLLDAAINFCNAIPYEKRIVRYFRQNLWHELLLGYLHKPQLEQAVETQVADEMAGSAPVGLV